MEAFKHYAMVPIMGMPAWSFVLFAIVIPVVNEAIMRSKNVKAMSFLQWLVNFVKSLPLVSSIPLVKQILNALATKPMLVLVLLGALTGGCGMNPEVAMWQAVGTTAVTVSTGYRALAAVDKTKQAAMKQTADKSTAELDAWLKVYGEVRKPIDDASVAVEAAPAAIDLIKMGRNKSHDAAMWIGGILKLAGDVVKAMAKIGVQLPAGLPTSSLEPGGARLALAGGPPAAECYCGDLECVTRATSDRNTPFVPEDCPAGYLVPELAHQVGPAVRPRSPRLAFTGGAR